jgi:hypothetical protein
MKKLRNLIAVMAMMSMATFLTGCGDDDDNDDDDVVPPGQNIVAPLDEASLTAQNKTYTVNVAGQNDPITLTFPANGQYQLQQAGVTEVGTITAATRDVNRWTMNVNPNEGQDGAQAGVLQLDFTANNAGAWTFTPTEGAAETGTFTVAETPGGGDNGGDNGGDTGGGYPPTALSGHTLQLAGERFDFTSESALFYEPQTVNIAGTYIWDPTSRNLDITLPSTGQRWQLTLPATNNSEVQVDYSEPGASQTYTANSNLTVR